MDPRYFGTNLRALAEDRDQRGRLSREAEQDAYYVRHAPLDRRAPPIVSGVVAVLLGFFAFGTLFG